MEKAENGEGVTSLDSVNRKQALALNDSGIEKYRRVDFDDAISDYTRAIELDPVLAPAYYNRGTIRYRLGEYRSALEDLAKARQLEPGNAEFSEAYDDCRKMCEPKKSDCF